MSDSRNTVWKCSWNWQPICLCLHHNGMSRPKVTVKVIYGIVIFIPSRYIDHATKHQAHSQQISEIKFNLPVNLQSLIIVIRACNYELNRVMEHICNHRRVPLFITFFLTALISILRTCLPVSLWLWKNSRIMKAGDPFLRGTRARARVCVGGRQRVEWFI